MKRRKNYVRHTDVVVVSVASAILGAVVSAVAIFSERFPVVSAEGGNAADWLAAVGTWVIGYGAWKYAREAHFQRLGEVDRAIREQNEAKIRRLNVILIKLRRASKLNRISKHALGDDVHGPLHLPKIYGALTALPSILETLKWSPEEILTLSPLSQRLLSNVEHEVLTVTVLLGVSEKSQKAKKYPSLRADFAVLGRACDRAHVDAEKLITRVDARLKKLRNDGIAHH